jgi:hypothetical protein
MKRSEAIELMKIRYEGYKEANPSASVEEIMNYVLKGLEATGLTSKFPVEYASIQKSNRIKFWDDEGS